MKSSIFEGLAPVGVWSIFEEILRIPRPSKHEEKIREYLVNFAKGEGLEYVVDKKGNVVIYKPASEGYESHPGVILQGHMDMVCEKDAGVEHDFMQDPIDAYIEDGWVKARGTTLGGDCGIGMAMQLAVLRDKSLKHPFVEALFTVDEEQGLSGAMELDPTILRGKYLINLDSEDEGEVFIGCAGGIDTIATFSCPQEPLGSLEYEQITIKISGLLGGHSGDDINKGRACANKLLGWMLYKAMQQDPSSRLVSIDGGNLRNAIARDAQAVLIVSRSQVQDIKDLLQTISDSFSSQYETIETSLKIEVLIRDCQQKEAINRSLSMELIKSIVSIPHGVQDMSRSMPGLVETSTNLASLKQDKDKVLVTTSQRSSDANSKDLISTSIRLLFEQYGASVKQSDGYPGWQPNVSSLLLKVSEDVYKKIFFKSVQVKAIHAGLECGIILSKYPKAEAISIGPTLRNAHSPYEKLDISSVEGCMVYLEGIIERL